ncbi:MAG: hypothetical protein AB1631_33660, partial [Acidobacteriota bacterium]
PMKHTKRIMTLLALFVLLMNVNNTLASPPIHSVTGSGIVSEEGVTFRTTVAAFKDDNGQARGWVVVNLDLTAFGLGKITFHSRVVCLHVNGNSAWVGAVVTHSTNEEIIPVGAHSITLVRDLGGNGEDIMHGELFDPGVSCSDEPQLPETIVISGNYSVR